MREVFVIGLVGLALVGILAPMLIHPGEDAFKRTLAGIDQSIIALRHGSPEGARASLKQASGEYTGLHVEDVNPELNNLIRQSFVSCKASPAEDNLRSLRGQVSEAGGELGISLPLIYEHSICLILLVSALFSLLVTFITKRVVDWPRVKQIKAEVGAWQRELRDAQRKRDMKRVHKLQLEQKRIFALQSQVMGASFKPMLFYFVPWLLLWMLLGRTYSGWVVAWLPFSIPLPFFGLWASCGFLSWLLVTYFGFSSLWRKVLIGD